jgi:Spy/CpxP family protein refolding chaperone
MTQELSLTEAQEQKLRGIMEEQRPQREALRERIAANRDALNELLESGSADANAVGQLVLEGRKLHEEARAQREAEQKAIRGLLTPDQQKKFDAMQERRRDRGPGRGPDPRGPGGWPGQGSGGGPGGPSGGMPRPPLGQSKSGQQPFLP